MINRAIIAKFSFLSLVVAAFLFVAPPTYAAGPTTVFSNNYQLWDASSDVQLLQQFLNAHGFIVSQRGAGSPGNETTTFGPHTYHALVQFQNANGLPATGFFGPLTRAAINSGGVTSNSSQSSPTNSAATAAAASTATTTQSSTPLPGYQPGQLIFGGGSSNAPSCSIFATPSTVTSGSSALVAWSSSNAVSALLSGAGSVALSSSESVSPTTTTAYTLTVTNSAGASGTCSATIIVSGVVTPPPTVSLTAPTIGANLSGSSVTLSATASSSVAIADVQFKVDGANIGSPIFSAPYTYIWNSNGVADGSHTLSAVAADTVGNLATSSISVTVRNTPPVISSISTGVSYLSATTTWTTDEAANSKVVFGTTTAYGFASSSAIFLTSHSIALSGLTASSTYHYAVVSADAGRNTSTSTDQTFSTLSTSTPPVISSISSTPTTTAATITWTTDQSSNSQVVFGTTTAYGTASSSSPFVTSHSLSITGLATSTTYHFAVVTANTFGATATSSDQTFTTSSGAPDNIPPTIPTNLVATPVSSSQINLSWTASNDNGGGDSCCSYKVYRDGSQVGTTTSGTTYNDTGLSPSTFYAYWIAAYDAAGNVSTTSTALAAVSLPGPDQFGTTWKPVRIGAGGFISDMDIASDGTKAIHTDTYGAYVCGAPCAPGGAQHWSQVVLTNTMPSGDPGAGLQQNNGVYEIRIAPSNTSRLYMYFNGYVYRSDDIGATWSATGFSHVAASGNDQITEAIGPYIAIDPNNSSIVYVGTPSAGLLKSTNAGATFSSVSAVGVGSTTPTGAGQGGGNIIAFDPSSSVIGGVTQGIYVSTYGVGVFHSIDGGSTWTELNSSGMPTTHQHMVVTSGGTLYFVDDTANTQGNLWKYSGGAWTEITTGLGAGSVRAVAVDPANASRIVVTDAVGDTAYSSNSGGSWTSLQTPSKVATDIPWLANTANIHVLAPGNIVFDPSQSNVLYMPDGTGVWQSNPATGGGLTWTSQSTGIEQLVANWAVSPPSGNPIFTFDDRPVFTVTNPNAYPTQHGLNYNNVIIHGYSADWASLSPSTIIVHAQNGPTVTSGFSSNGGGADGGPSNWTVFSGLSGITDLNGNGGVGTGGSIAAASSTNFVLALNDNYAGQAGLWVTTNAGASWTKPSISGIATTGDAGWGGEYYFDRQIVAADRVNIGTYYAYNQGSAGSTAGVYKSTNGGATWSLVHSGTFDSGAQSFFNAQMRTVPGEAGNLFFTSGPQTGDPVGEAFHRSTDGGTTWTTVPNVEDVWSFGFGKAAPGTTTPAIYIYGWVNGVGGVWRSDDNAATWTQLSGLYPLNSFDQVKVVEGDMNAYGRVYLGFAGSGFEYGDASDAQIPPIISSISSGTATTTSATITWTTDQSSNSSIVYGTTNAYGSASSSATLVTSHSITLSGLASGTTYHYSVVSANAQGYTAASTDQTFTTVNNTPPSVPAGLTATATSSTEIDLSWSASTGDGTYAVAGYQVFRNGSQVGTTTSGTTFADTGLAASTTYSYAVDAYDTGGNVSAQSGSVSTTTQAGVTFTPTDDPAIQYLGFGGPTVTFSNVNIGTPSSDRVVVIGVVNSAASADGGTRGVTIGGITATQAVFSDSTTTNYASLWYASAPTGTSATVVVTAGGGIEEMGILAGAINGASSVAPSATSTHPRVFDSGDPQIIPTSGTVTVPTNGVAVLFGIAGDTGTAIWTNTTNASGDYFLATTTGNGAAEMMAHSYATGAQSYSVSSSVNNGFAFGGFGGVVAVWKP